MRRIMPVAAAALCLASQARAAGNRLVGTWLTEDGQSRVKIASCGSAVCATIVWVREPGRDENNPDPSLRGRDIVGVQLTHDMRHARDGGWAGSIYNPDNGKTYAATMRQQGEDRLDVGGCVMAGLICGSETWSRQADEVANADRLGAPRR